MPDIGTFEISDQPVDPVPSPETPLERSLGGPLLTALSRLPQDVQRLIFHLAGLIEDYPESGEPFRLMIDAIHADRPIGACRAALDLIAAFFPNSDG